MRLFPKAGAPAVLALLIAAAAWYLWPVRPLEPGTRADRLAVIKSERRLILFRGGQVLKTYPVSLGWQPLGPKYCQGDGRTPEGSYVISAKNPHSKYHLALRISYPGPTDRARAEEAACNPGGDIMIHGLPRGLGYLGRFHRFYDWTQGCIALTDLEIEEIYLSVPVGTPVLIEP